MKLVGRSAGFVHKRARVPDEGIDFVRGASRRQAVRDTLSEVTGGAAPAPKSRAGQQRFSLTFLMADRERTVVHFDAPSRDAAKKHACAAFMTERDAIGMRLKPSPSEQEESDDDDE